MKNKNIFVVLILFSVLFSVFTSSCKKNKNPQKKELTFTTEQVSKAINIKNEKPPRSQKKFGEFECNGIIVSSPSAYNNSQNPITKTKLETLTGSSASTKVLVTGINGWNDSKNAIFFDLDGTYVNFNQSENSWEWGYYYINKELTVIVFDPLSQNENLWSILSLTKEICTIKTKSNITKTMEFVFMVDIEESFSFYDPNVYLINIPWISFMRDTTGGCPKLTFQDRTFLDNGVGTSIDANNKTIYWAWSVKKSNSNIYNYNWLLTTTEGSIIKNYYINGPDNGNGTQILIDTTTSQLTEYCIQSYYESLIFMCQN